MKKILITKIVFLITLALMLGAPFSVFAAEDGDQCFCYNASDGCERPGVFDPQSQADCNQACDDTYGDEMDEDLGVIRAVFVPTGDAGYESALDDCLDVAAVEAVHSGDPDVKELVTPIVPKLNVNIPGFSGFTDVVESGGYMKINFLAEYVTAWYRWLVGSAAIIATVMIMIGGVQYMLGKGMGQITSAKNRIRSAVIGLVLLLGSYVILFTMNPQLTLFEPLSIQYVQPSTLDDIIGDTDEGVSIEMLHTIGIDCPSSMSVYDTATQFVGLVTYRFGGKGRADQPPFNSEDLSNTCAPDGEPCRDFCPDETICLDCSGYVQLVSQCAGLPKRSRGGTASIFVPSESAILTSCETAGAVIEDPGSNSTIDYNFQIGDYLGWSSDDNACDACGHVVMYYGNGQIIHNQSGGRASGMGIKIEPWESFCNNFSNPTSKRGGYIMRVRSIDGTYPMISTSEADTGTLY